MSNSVPFDTLKFVEKLEAGGFTHAQAKAAAEAFAEATSQELATKSDIAGVKANLRETELRLEAKIEATKTEIIKWLFGTIGFQTLVILGAVLALVKFAQP